MASELNIAAFLQPAVDKLNQLSERERGILTAVVLVSTVVAFLEFIWSPALLELKSLDKDRQVLVRNQVTLANTVETLTQQLAEDLDAPMNLQNAQLQQQLMDQEQRLYALGLC